MEEVTLNGAGIPRGLVYPHDSGPIKGPLEISVTFDEVVLTPRRIFTCIKCGRTARGEMEYKNICQVCLTKSWDEMHSHSIDAGIPREKRPASEEVKARRRASVDTDVKFYNSMRWRRYSTKLRADRPWCDIQMNYILVNELGLEEILPWFSQLGSEMKLRFLRRKGCQGEIETSNVTDHIIPIKSPFLGSYWNPRNHQAASHRWHNIKRKLEQNETCEEFIGAERERIPKRMQAGMRRLSDTPAQILKQNKRRPRGGANPS